MDIHVHRDEVSDEALPNSPTSCGVYRETDGKWYLFAQGVRYTEVTSSALRRIANLMDAAEAVHLVQGSSESV